MSEAGVGLFALKKGPSPWQEDEKSRLEYESLKSEFIWLMEMEYPLKLAAMDRCMEDCYKKFSIVLNPSGGREVRPILLQEGDTVFCMVSVDGDKISKADITLKLPGRKPLRTAIKEHAAWKLKQIQDSANHFRMAREKYEAIKEAKDVVKTPAEISQMFSDLAASLHLAEEVLVLPQLPRVQNIYAAERRSHLKPELPEDIAVHFHISSSLLVLSILAISQAPKLSAAGQRSQHSGKDETDSMDWLSSTFDHGASTFEVSNQIQVSSQVPWLTSVLRLLQDAHELAQDLIDKVKVFQPLEQL